MSNPNPISHHLTRGIQMLSIVLILVGLFAVAQPTQADAIIVTTPLDNVAGCLRYAIDTANTTPGPDTITFHPDTNGIFITLTGSSGDDVNLSGDLDILSNGDLVTRTTGYSISVRTRAAAAPSPSPGSPSGTASLARVVGSLIWPAPPR